MSDFKVQYISGTIPAGSTSVSLVAPTNFEEVGAITSAFVMPAGTLPTCGLGDSADGGEIRQWAVSANMTATDTIVLARGNTSTNAMPYAFWIIEYIGVAGGRNEFIVRGRGEAQFTDPTLTLESAAISNVATLGKCVPFISGRYSNAASTSLRNFMVEAVIANNGSANVVQFSRVTGTGTPTWAWQAVEFTGANWTIQQGRTTGFNTANANVDTLISAVGAISRAWVHTYFAHSISGAPVGGIWYAWLSSTTNLRARVALAGTASGLRWFIIENADTDFTVETINAVDAVDDFSAGSSPQTQTVNVTAVTTLAEAFVTGRLGSSDTTTTNNPAAQWRVRMQDADTVEAFRTKSLGGTEYVLQVVDLNEVIGLDITDITTPLVDGSNFTITGHFGTVTAVTLGGVAQAAVSADSTTIVRTATLGTLKYGTYNLVVTADGSVTVPSITIDPPTGKKFVNLSTLTGSGQRLTATPDISPGDQIEWTNVVGGTINDVQVFDDGSFSSVPAVTAFDFRVNDGTGWGTSATQTISNQATDTTNIIRRIVTDFSRLFGFDLINIEHDT